eukprot:2410375-Ditylum_brightwellii.AAC.1
MNSFPSRMHKKIEGLSNSEYAKDESRCSVNGLSVFLCKAPIILKSKRMPIVVLLVTEVQLFAVVQCAQDMLYAMIAMTGVKLKVGLPIVLYLDNKAAKYFINNWSVGGRT